MASVRIACAVVFAAVAAAQTAELNNPDRVTLLQFPPASFRETHPRLPVPDQDYLDRLRANARVFADYRRLADEMNPAGPLRLDQSSALLIMGLATNDAAYLTKIKTLLRDGPPGLVYWADLYFRAYAYDWFYAHFSADERRTYLDKIIRLLETNEDLLVETAPSPFNDVGYNRFEAAILTGALVAYRDHPRGEEHLEFATLYFNDVLLACRRVMGRTGGWHEGTEYIAIGVAKVLPRILWEWRAATGVDLFRANAWVEGMLYHAIYKLRPDRTPSRTADIAHLLLVADGAVYPLAIEYRNPYGLWFARRMTFDPGGNVGTERQPNGLEPSLWPWGPVDRPEYAERPPDSLPLARLFEGTGEVIMRSGWSEDDTVIEYKAGPHFWSHSNLDQGGFTVYKRGALAIDSGAYSAYGDAHHMNYRRQTISKNAILVYDPADLFTMPNGSPLANDGGQRRVEGWFGVGAPSLYMEGNNYINRYFNWARAGRNGRIPLPTGPSSLDLWRQRADTFEMGRVLAFEQGAGFAYVHSDLTRAYTNATSGAHPVDRTRRVRGMTRSLFFASQKYLVLFDRVDAFHAQFAKRWLLHSINEPAVSGPDIDIVRTDTVTHRYGWPLGLRYTSANRSAYQYDGRLRVRTLLPAGARLTKVGGPGRGFEIDGTNYNQAGTSDDWAFPNRTISTDPLRGPLEAGGWRMEVSPPQPSETDYFLHVLLPQNSGGSPLPATETITAATHTGVAIADQQMGEVVLFPREGADLTGVTYDVAQAAQSQHTVLGLRAGRYQVLSAGQLVAAADASGAGVLRFVAASGGRFQIRFDASAAAPQTSPGAITGAATFRPGPLVAGSITSVFGANLAPRTVAAQGFPLPTELDSVSVEIDGIQAPLLFVSPGQINLQVPWEVVKVNVTMVIRVNGVASTPVQVAVAAAAPGIFAVMAGPDRTLSLYLTGLGALASPARTGEAARSPVAMAERPSVTIGGVEAGVLYAGLAPGFAGLYQINVRLAPGASGAIVVRAAGANSPSFPWP